VRVFLTTVRCEKIDTHKFFVLIRNTRCNCPVTHYLRHAAVLYISTCRIEYSAEYWRFEQSSMRAEYSNVCGSYKSISGLFGSPDPAPVFSFNRVKTVSSLSCRSRPQLSALCPLCHSRRLSLCSLLHDSIPQLESGRLTTST
jgi:hypothetical protein